MGLMGKRLRRTISNAPASAASSAGRKSGCTSRSNAPSRSFLARRVLFLRIWRSIVATAESTEAYMSLVVSWARKNMPLFLIVISAVKRPRSVLKVTFASLSVRKSRSILLTFFSAYARREPDGAIFFSMNVNFIKRHSFQVCTPGHPGSLYT